MAQPGALVSRNQLLEGLSPNDVKPTLSQLHVVLEMLGVDGPAGVRIVEGAHGFMIMSRCQVKQEQAASRQVARAA
jgi:hypothetical protein